MPDFFYQIKGKADDGFSVWAWPPVFSGMVKASDRTKARILIEDEYSRSFPCRVLRKDLQEHHCLLNIREVSPDDDRTRALFEFKPCLRCGARFRVIDLYNDHNERYKGRDFCGASCRDKFNQEHRAERFESMGGDEQPVIYRIKNVITGKSYIGKTTQVFTLRWYQHFYHGGSCKFHQAIKESNVGDWEFRIIECVQVPEESGLEAFVSTRERHWIQFYDSVNNGYNTV